jgi:hypothetical protein
MHMAKRKRQEPVNFFARHPTPYLTAGIVTEIIGLSCIIAFAILLVQASKSYSALVNSGSPDTALIQSTLSSKRSYVLALLISSAVTLAVAFAFFLAYFLDRRSDEEKEQALTETTPSK